MKKILTVFTLMILAIFLVGCSSIKDIQKNFEKEEYTLSAKLDSMYENLVSELEEDDIVIKPYLYTKGLKMAILFEFKNTKELEKAIEDSHTLAGLIADLQQSDLVNGNVLLIPIAFTSKDVDDIISIFQGKK